MLRETIDIPTSAGTAEAYVTRPDEHDHPGVLLYMDAIGIRPRLRDMADRIAGWGYVVMVPNLFYRDGTIDDLQPRVDLTVAGNREAFFAEAMPRVHALVPELAAADADIYVHRLQHLPGVRDSPIGCVGYCMGGALSLRSAGLYSNAVAAAASFHGGNLVTDAETSPHLIATRSRARLYLGHADNDPSMPRDKIAVLESAFESAGLLFVSKVYPEAAHGFTMADTPVYQEDGAERHFTALEDLFHHGLMQ